MNRTELERLDREALIARAEQAGVTRARILTRLELVDELLLRSSADRAQKQQARGLFGRARDLLARVVERGLHLPDAADRLRALGGETVPRPRPPAALPTVTLAEIYAAQGHRDRAIETLDRVLSIEPEHAAAQALLAQLRDAAFPVQSPRLPPEADDSAAPPVSPGSEPHGAPQESETAEGLAPAPAPSEAAPGFRVDLTGPLPAAEPLHMLDDAPLPTRYDVNECVAIPVDPTTLYAYWEIRDKTIDYVRAARPGGDLALRAVVIVPTWDGPRSTLRDYEVEGLMGDFFVRELPLGCVVRVAIGYRHGEAFVPIAHSQALETPAGTEAPLVADAVVRWTADATVAASRRDPDAPSMERAARRVRRGAGELLDPTPPGGAEPQGSSERWAVAPR